ncbi:hypothetical protein PVA44_01910 [Entomospira nematocerorum]|uniref:Uncharacterized protein n=1 Tax=Entomospira nematocerorum TaxID=2719987 RepID=A0A968GC79_9SPIO|nr:hypothetical protein [Entomospira nematocera]NIZ47212.1 hypothetical protein [Entomospira nematocera]WDI34245.1 hypothetical protein PVA44_01910 [Entomospira nematocera]
MKLWPFWRQSKKNKEVGWQIFLEQWQKNTGNNRIAMTPSADFTSMQSASLALWGIYQDRIVLCIYGKDMQVEQMRILMDKIPSKLGIYREYPVTFILAPVTVPHQIFLQHECYSVQMGDTKGYTMWLDPRVYTENFTSEYIENPLFRYTLFYHMMIARFKEEAHSLSLHMAEIKETSTWLSQSGWVIMEVLHQQQTSRSELRYWISWPAKGDTNGSWMKIVKRFCFYAGKLWADANVQIIFKEIAQSMKQDNVVLAHAEIRYKEPYRLPIDIVIGKEMLDIFTHTYLQEVNTESTFWQLYHTLNISLWAKHHQRLTHMALYGSVHRSPEEVVAFASICLFLPEIDLDKILQNFLGVFYTQKIKALFAYVPLTVSSDVRWVVSDVFEGNLLSKLPRSVALEWAYQVPSQGLEQWMNLNEEVMTALVKHIQHGKINLTTFTKSIIVDEVMRIQQARYYTHFEEKYEYFYDQYWIKMPSHRRLQLAGRIHNQQWAFILTLKPALYTEIATYMSARRKRFLREEVIYLQSLNVKPYAEALRILYQIVEIKY